jgi:hypothetical protein
LQDENSPLWLFDLSIEMKEVQLTSVVPADARQRWLEIMSRA